MLDCGRIFVLARRPYLISGLGEAMEDLRRAVRGWELCFGDRPDLCVHLCTEVWAKVGGGL